MYFVKYGTSYLHDPRTTDRILSDLSLDCEENSCGFCDFTIYPNHPMHNQLKERDADNPIEVWDDDNLLFSGFIYELGEEFYLSGQVKCKGELDYLNESIVRPYSTIEKSYCDLAPTSPSSFFEWLINQHNKQVHPNKQFVVGINQASMLDSNDYIYRESSEYPTTIEEISEKLIDNDSIGGYLRIRHENGIRYIDYLSEWTEVNTQILDFGQNLTDYSRTDDSSELATFIVPIGARMSDTEYSYNDGYFVTSDKNVDKNKEYYTKNENGYHYCGYILAFESDKKYYEFEMERVRYYVTSDKTVNTNKTYYTKSSDGSYTECYDLKAFESGTTYYEYDDGYFLTSDKMVDANKDYYTKEYSYSSCSELQAFESGVTYYEYDENKDESDAPLTIKDASDGRYTMDMDYRKKDDMIYCSSAVEKYGWIGTTYKNQDLTIRESLIFGATYALKELVSPKRTIEIKAIDMHLVNPNIKPISIGEYVRVRSKPHNLDSYFLCRNINLDLSNPESSVYTLGTTFATLTGQQNNRIKKLNAEINRQYEVAASIGEKAKETAKIASTTAKQAKEEAEKAKEAADVAIVNMVDEYSVSTDPYKEPISGWISEPPKYTNDVFIWRRTIITYGDGTVVTGAPVIITGNSGSDGEDAILLRIDSSRGTVFKNNSISTVLSVTIYKGSKRIINASELRETFGTSAYLEWSWQRLDESEYGIISSTDKMISNDGFSLTISAEEVDTKVTFMCELKV